MGDPKNILRPFFAISVLGSLYISTLYTINKYGDCYYWFHVVASIFFVLSLFYMLLSMCYRGKIDYKSMDMALLGYYSSNRFCRKCDNFKPERAHHCSNCNSCIKKMNHHCVWLNTCVNYDNQGHFIRFLTFTILSNYCIFMYWARVFYRIITKTIENRGAVFYCVNLLVIVVSGSLAIALSCFLYYRKNFIFNNQTFIEELQMSDNKKNCQYDCGLLNNLQDVLGPAYLLFMFGPFGDSITFKKAYANDKIGHVAHEYYDIEKDMLI